jgi:CDP-glycerol glycerophosphotransferase (TagB/SpsB family)
MLKFFKYLVCYLVYPFSFLSVRKRSRIAFGCPKNRFEGNPKYLFIEYSRKGYDVCWISADRSTVKDIQAKGLKARYLLSPGGLHYAITSKWWMVGAYSSDILFFLSGGAKIFNLWHGVGLKLCEFNIKSGPLADRYCKKTLKERFYHPEVYKRPDLFLSASAFQTGMFSPAFRIPASRCIEEGYPRNQILLCNENTRRQFIAGYEDPATARLIEELSAFRKVYVYMPTWRDSGASALQNFDYSKIDAVLRKNGDALLVKDHFNNADGGAYREGSIFHLHPAADIYPVLPYTDVLITDYSSVLYDYILMEGKSVILYIFDYNAYTAERDFFYPFEENVIGEKALTLDELLGILERGPEPLDQARRQALIQKFWDGKQDHYDFNHYLHL